MVFVELHYTPGLMLQAEDRAHRIGQRSAVNIHYLVARGTLDEILWSVVRRKVSRVGVMSCHISCVSVISVFYCVISVVLVYQYYVVSYQLC